MKQRPPADKMPSAGILTLLEQRGEDDRADSVEQKCKKISETIYQCLSDRICRHKFNYESISLCSWPHPDYPDRSPHTTPCTDTSGDEPLDDK